ncbi:MAG: MIP/aquaporin family protein [Carnobacterium sp.]|uniref:MIP channel s family protein n=2 Tax=Carnobacterium maltaromaticum TaxID=2751 RepID=K8E198_CARML|nr:MULTISPECIES: MIP/aquaporin family protein [Carnobacterium]KRN73057.1 glycerol facilitator protein [Carnobacterium maltaromaticum]KRN86303.1 glycerol facilitator protein [Carnobacterium maltaromaticum]MBC9808862.1 MIP family channel protein [Carnobacterium maltaromaticum]MBQ6483619.1 aquaporin family protein [Carnobacterium sp.]MCC4311273.1 glycerol transporter [Carnobacterium maltaromaticum]
MSGDTLQIFSEFLGTLILVLLGDGVCAAVNLKKSKAEASGWIVIALGWGAAVTIAVYVAGFMGPAHLNPAVTIAMAIAGNFSWSLVVPFILAQVAGGVIGATLVWLTYLDHWQATEDKGAILGTFATGPAIRNYPANVLTEMIGTIVLVLGLLSFSQHTFADGMNPLVVGVLIVSIGLSLGGATGYAINPARDLGPRIAHQILPIANKGDSDWSYSWVPVVGPVLGAIIAAGIFLVIM